MKKVYILENLGCANCGAKIEKDVSALPNVEEAVLVFPTKQLRITASDDTGLKEEIERIAKGYESGINVRDRDEAVSQPEHDEHEHHHHDGDDDDCCCGHDHEHEHEHHHHDGDDDCCCGHDHEHEHEHESHEEADIPAGAVRKVYILESLGCANCGAKIEKAVGELPNVVSSVLVFPTKQLRVAATDTTGLKEQIQEIAASFESEITVKDRDESAPKSQPSNKPDKKAEDKSEPKQSWFKEHQKLVELICGAALFVIGLLLDNIGNMFVPSLIFYIAAYVVLGGEVVVEAVKHLFTGLVFDESFLMTVATIGAFAIKQFPEAVGVMLFFQIGEYFEDVAVEKSRSQIMEAVDLRPEVVTLEKDGDTSVIPAGNAKIGDILVVHPGDRIPLDGTVLTGESYLDTSAITGEPVPVRIHEGDSVTSGCVNKDGLLRIRVEHPLSESMVTRIMDSVENAAASKPKIDRFITRFARVYTPFVVALAAIVAIVPSLVTGNWHHWVYTALTFLVISCPCALVLSVPLAFFSGIGTGSKKGILFKGGVSLEALNSIKAAVMDKTGTITYGTFTVTSIEPADGITPEALLSIAASCELNSTHPIALSIMNSAKEKNIVPHRPDSVHETAGHGIETVIEGKTFLCGNAKLMNNSGIALPELSDASGSTAVLLACDGKFIGRLLLSDTLKKNAAETVSALKSKGITTAILTGDSLASANAIAAKAGIPEVHAQLLPQQKLEQLSKIREKYGPVLFVGDGINDAPVLAGADVGAAMGTGADAAIEAADVVFLTSELNAIPTAISISHAACSIAKQNVIFALAVKALIMVLGLLGIASMWLAVFADTGVALLCVLNSIRILYMK